MVRGFAHIPTFRAATVVRLALALLLAMCGSSYAHAQADVTPGTVADGVLRDGVNAAGTVADIAPDVAAALPDDVAIVAAAASAADVAPAPAAEPTAPAANNAAPDAETAVPADSASATSATELAAETADSAAATSATEFATEFADSAAATSATEFATEFAAETADSVSPAETTRQWRLPEDRLAGKPYNKHFRSGEVLKGDPTLVRPGFLLDQNLFGALRLTTHGNFRFTEEFTIYYRRNKTDIDTSYLWNPAQITQLRSFLRKDIVVDTITVYAYASPEGHYGHNVWLSRQRAENARKYIVEEYGYRPLFHFYALRYQIRDPEGPLH